MIRSMATVVAIVSLATTLPVAGDHAAATKPAGKCMMWTVKSRTATVYLVGSIHMGRADLYPLPREMEQAFARSDLLVEEVKDGADVDKAFNDAWWDKTQYTGGDSLPKHLTPEQWEEVKAVCESVGVRPDMAESSRPGMVCLMISYMSLRRGAAHDAEATREGGLVFPLGIDRHFADEAAARKLPTDGLETDEFQSESMLRWVNDRSADDLVGFVARIKAARRAATTQPVEDGVDATVRRWSAGDAEAEACSLRRAARHSEDGGDLTLYRLDERNARMTDRIERYLDGTKTVFVVVGCAHLVGDRGIVQMLRDDGFVVEQSSATRAEKPR